LNPATLDLCRGGYRVHYIEKLEAAADETDGYFSQEAEAAFGDYYRAVRRGEPITDDLLARVEKANAGNFSRGCAMTIQEAGQALAASHPRHRSRVTPAFLCLVNRQALRVIQFT